ncbi:hypothetical protein RhiirA5_482856 [Rhizophagus irregularis]|uniref:Uncharacterized protein n=3 Tax=Rhizophagus irregularis TaxID=588596 RepID=U9TLL9_RHIID|nr:hypothetical protein GLOIN_2v1880645 [Rhizophagus irregularis DAOM 181602=DAOM 197198]EXX54553.1 hypothetical protein RirG_233520 [Rhizophagus irregularis DAOM 197198w]PKC06427.1 hypothetical protein RhiirA5_482856 [Rhizophagus irregularis]PKC68006.1 hypothetical protein RhiirA1_508215 [Rhizophagus irregularis]PKK79687.1 hypothetical protein RhiirC2_842411 [Rhizophagus irregularis]POG65338.1 hypothetical protein GLOIN_2v1880645 [Rhizophagus irregularis DAOM 181602=DAOM 197198]|eukprot:XP_025172204.1 hypothetical protein GLOIN_2v1880645 [Rhizophagus irregularis DAOM 181602=DAOM 197198]
MDHNNNTILRNDVNNIQNVFIDNEINNYSNAPTNVIQMRQPSSNVPCNNTNFPATPTMSYISNNHEQQATFSFINNQYTTSTTTTTQYHSTTTSYVPQYIGHNVNQNSPQFIQNISPPFNFPQTNHPQMFRFEIPGFEIIIVPTSPPFVNLNNLDMENHLQQDLSNNGY